MKGLPTDVILLVFLIASQYVNCGLAEQSTAKKGSPFGVMVRSHHLQYDSAGRMKKTTTGHSSKQDGMYQVTSKVAATTTSSAALCTSSSLRGGGCNDSDPTLFFKVGVSVVLESILMWTLLLSSIVLSNKFQPSIPTIFGEPLLELVSSFIVIFGSSFFGSIADDTLSAASKQVLSPNIVPGDPNWYSKLIKPWWTPPGWVFPIMWLIVSKPTQLCAISRIMKFGGITSIDTSKGIIEASAIVSLLPLLVYCTHLAMGDAWNKVFFGFQCPGRGLAIIMAFYGLLLTTTYIFYGLDSKAGYYMVPTCIWVTIATALNYSIYLNNKPQQKSASSK